MKLPVLIAAALLAASSALYAQPDPKAEKRGSGRPQRVDCAKAKDPQACEAELAKRRAVFAKARQACEGKQGAGRGECMRREICAQAKEPAQCEAQAKARMARHDKARAACKDQTGDGYRACMREQLHRK